MRTSKQSRDGKLSDRGAVGSHAVFAMAFGGVTGHMAFALASGAGVPLARPLEDSEPQLGGAQALPISAPAAAEASERNWWIW
ncbi:hypothetical protein GN244_ATG09485 [Phytophthora infestans]|uniref:Uncharacterized protein n=1 Tax=Phytophthora infestans TaxID=4787 RepID=A0A833SU46_PHYIN|nr:hypothetical protein GN244_ATG09485 [Phytophthora infestans]KAF4143390.1 hypothetical protein GN958_ATG07456 [Phytophthora infestans]